MSDASAPPAAPPPPPGRRWLALAPLLAAWALTGLAFARCFDPLVRSDSRNYLFDAWRLVEHGPSLLLSGEFRTAPGYPLLLALALKLGGPVAPYGLGLLLCLALFTAAWIGLRRLFPLPAAALGLSALCWITLASSPVQPTYLLHPFREAPTLLLAFAAFALLVRSPARGPGWGAALGAAGLLGLATLVRENTLLWLPGCWLWLVLEPGRPPRERALRAAVFTAPWVLLGLTAALLFATHGAWSGQTAHVWQDLLASATSDGELASRLAPGWPRFWAYALGLYGPWLPLAALGAAASLGRSRLWTLTWVLIVPQALLILFFSVYPRYVFFTLAVTAPWVALAWQSLAARRWPIAAARLGAGLAALGFLVAGWRLAELPSTHGFRQLGKIDHLLTVLREAGQAGRPVYADYSHSLVEPFVATWLRAHQVLSLPPQARPINRPGDLHAAERAGRLTLKRVTPRDLPPVAESPTADPLVLTGGEAPPRAFFPEREAHRYPRLPFAPDFPFALYSLLRGSATQVSVTPGPATPGTAKPAGPRLAVLTARQSAADPLELLWPGSTGEIFRITLPAPRDAHPVFRLVGFPPGFQPGPSFTLSGRTLHAKDVQWAQTLGDGQWWNVTPTASPEAAALFFSDAGLFLPATWRASGGMPFLTAAGADLTLPGVLGWSAGRVEVSLLLTPPGEHVPESQPWLERPEGRRLPEADDLGSFGRHPHVRRLRWAIPLDPMPEWIPLRLRADQPRLATHPTPLLELYVRWFAASPPPASPPAPEPR